MATQFIDASSNSTDEEAVTGAGGTVTNSVRAIFDDATPRHEIVDALHRLAELIEQNIVKTPL